MPAVRLFITWVCSQNRGTVFQSNPAKIFVGICTAFLIVWGALQVVASMRLEEDARLAAQRILSWKWTLDDGAESKGAAKSFLPGCEAEFRPEEATVKQRNQSDALVMVKGKQCFVAQSQEESAAYKTEEDCSITLSFYKHNNHWILGRVEME